MRRGFSFILGGRKVKKREGELDREAEVTKTCITEIT